MSIKRTGGQKRGQSGKISRRHLLKSGAAVAGVAAGLHALTGFPTIGSGG